MGGKGLNETHCPTIFSGACQKALISGEYYLTYPTANSALVLDTGNSSVYMAALGTRAEDTGYGAWSTEDLHSLNYHIEVRLLRKNITAANNDYQPTWFWSELSPP